MNNPKGVGFFKGFKNLANDIHTIFKGKRTKIAQKHIQLLAFHKFQHNTGSATKQTVLKTMNAMLIFERTEDACLPIKTFLGQLRLRFLQIFRKRKHLDRHMTPVIHTPSIVNDGTAT